MIGKIRVKTFECASQFEHFLNQIGEDAIIQVMQSSYTDRYHLSHTVYTVVYKLK